MKRFRLDITGKLEDRPRLLRAYGKIPGGEVALVLRPTAYGGVLVHVTKDGATQWSAGAENIPADWPRVRVGVRGGETTVLDGPLTGRVVSAPVLAQGSGSVALGPDGQVLAVDGDAPRVPADRIDARTAVATVKHAQRDVPKPGPATLRGQWSGTLTWDDGPYVELRRKLATYGSLVVSSGADGWRWRFEREQRWFSSAEHESDGPFATLVQAIDAGMLGALGLVQPACGVRDTRRRGAYDPSWAEAHPLPESKVSSDPTERLRDRSSSETSQSERKIRRSSSDAAIDAANVPSMESVPRVPRSPRTRSAPTPTSVPPSTRDAAGSTRTDADHACSCSIGSAGSAGSGSTFQAPVRVGSDGAARRSSRSGTSRSTHAAEATNTRGARSTPTSSTTTRSSSGGSATSSRSSSSGDSASSSRSSTGASASSKSSSTGGTSSSRRSSMAGNGGRSSRDIEPSISTASPGRAARPASSGSGPRSSSVSTPPAEASTSTGSSDEASLIQAFSAAVAAALID